MADAAPPALTLVLVRHGETVGESSIRYHGRTDVVLSDLGRAQMAAAREFLARRHGLSGFTPVFSSPLARAAEGARLIAGAGPLITVAEFAEVDFGSFEGLTIEEIAARYPAEFQRWRADPLAPQYTYPGGENRADFRARVERGVEMMLARIARRLGGADPTAPILVVAHRGVLRTIVRRLAGVEPQIDLASIHILCRPAGAAAWIPLALDLTEHLRQP